MTTTGSGTLYDGVPSTIGGNFNYTNNTAPLYVGYLGATVTGDFTTTGSTSPETYLDALTARNFRA